MNNGSPVGRIQRGFQSEIHPDNEHDGAEERVEDGVRGRPEQDVHL